MLNKSHFKIILLGNMNVGKSSIVIRHIYNKYSINTESTIGASFFKKEVTVDDKKYIVEMWDTSGQERFNSLIPMYYKNTNVAIVVFDVTNLNSFNNCQKIINNLRTHDDHIHIVLVGNKIDLSDRVIKIDDINKFTKINNIIYFECSANTGENVNSIFDYIFKFLSTSVTPNILTNISLTNTPEKYKCCNYS